MSSIRKVYKQQYFKACSERFVHTSMLLKRNVVREKKSVNFDLDEFNNLYFKGTKIGELLIV